jgi:hypothetical protein
MKLKFFFTFFTVIHFSPLESNAGEYQAQIIQSALPTLKKVANYVDTEVIDKMIIATCSSTGAALGHALSIKVLQQYYGGRYFNPENHLEDDLGWYLGMVAGYHLGEFTVRVRHHVTDPLFTRLGSFTITSLTVIKTLIESTAINVTTKICTKLQTHEEKMKHYIHRSKKKEHKLS